MRDAARKFNLLFLPLWGEIRQLNLLSIGIFAQGFGNLVL